LCRRIYMELGRNYGGWCVDGAGGGAERAREDGSADPGGESRLSAFGHFPHLSLLLSVSSLSPRPMQGPLASTVTPYERGRRFLKPGETLRAGESLTSVDCKSKLVRGGRAIGH